LSAKVAANKHRVYGDRDCIGALEAFLDRAARAVPLTDAGAGGSG
jgi:hypothetical protein